MATVADLVKMSSKGQLVVPQSIREELGLEPGDRFAAVPVKEGILFKRLDVTARLAEFEAFAEEIREQFKKNKITKKDIADAIKWARARRKS